MSVTPIIPGFHPDPSICRVGADYYLVNSSFEYRPGVPVFHSRDLVTWELLGNVLDRDSQLTLPSSAGSGGIYAPTIRHHDGRFWMTTTDIGRVFDGHLIVSASNPAGPWTDPVFVAGSLGIDPDLFWDQDGTCYLTWSNPIAGHGILQAPVDPGAGILLAEPRPVWQGTGLAAPEGPHIYRRGDWYYVLLAEGGTERGHTVTIARSRSLDGPWEANPANPILTHRSTTHPVQNTGHADLIERPDGTWAMVHLGVRPVGPTPGYHLNGRETFLTGIDWVDDWPIVREDAFAVPAWDADLDDDFSTTSLDPRWIAPGPSPASFVTRAVGGGLEIRPLDEHRPLLAIRTEYQSWEARATVQAGTARLTLRLDEAHWASVESTDRGVVARLRIGPAEQEVGVADHPGDRLTLTIRSTPWPTDPYLPATAADRLELGFTSDGEFRLIAEFDGRYLSTEVASGFTGRVVGVEPIPQLGTPAVLSRFEYRQIS